MKIMCDFDTARQARHLAEVVWELVHGGIGVERFADLLRLVPSDDFQQLL